VPNDCSSHQQLEIQAKLLDQSLDEDSFIDLVRQIADEQVQKALTKKAASS